jgi:menaquinone-dependent protoporphyrinogen IX oxidase
MSKKKVLILYGTRYGSTEGISERIEKILKENEIEVLVVDLKRPPKDNTHLAFEEYNGILMGTGIRAGQWTKDAKKFASKNKDELNSFEGKLGFFVSSGYAAVPEQYEKIKTKYTKDALNKLGVEKLDFYEAFGGLMDLSDSSRMSWVEKKILTLVGSQSGLEADSDQEITDLRDWDQIEGFAREFIQLF